MKLSKMRPVGSVLGLIAVWAISSPASAQDKQFEFGFRPMVLASQGEPANDMLGFGFVGTWHWKDDWYFGAALDFMEFDFERPQRALGIEQPEGSKTIDGTDDFTRLSGWIERRYDTAGNWDWYWNAGLGFASPNPGVVTGPTAGGGTYNIVTTASDEIHLMSTIGTRRAMGENWMFSAGFHLEYHLTDYKFVDTVSGAMGQIGSHTPVGATVLFSYRF